MALIRLNNQSLTAVSALPAADGSSLTGLSAGGLQLVNRTSFNEAEPVTLDNIFTSDYEVYDILLFLNTSVNNIQVQMKFIESDGTIEADSIFDYAFNGQDNDSTSRPFVANDSSVIRLCTALENTNSFSMRLNLFHPQTSTEQTYGSCLIASTVNVNDDTETLSGAFSNSSTQSYRGLQFKSNLGGSTLDGQFYCYGLAKS
jgi:hypothetical protein